MPALIACGAGTRRLGIRQDEGPNCLLCVWQAMLLCAVLLGPTASMAERCGPEITSDDPLGYAWRGGFCDGRCSEDVAVATIELLSLHEGAWPALDGDQLLLTWPPPEAGIEGLGEDRLLIRSADFDVCYRLDRTLPANAASATWPLDRVQKLDPGRSRLGVTVRRSTEDGEVTLPVRSATSASL